MTADMLAEAQATGYALSDAAEIPSSSGAGNEQGSETPNPSASSSGTEGPGNVPNSAQGASPPLEAPQSANTNEESPSAHSDNNDESADYGEDK